MSIFHLLLCSNLRRPLESVEGEISVVKKGSVKEVGGE